jgi:hypothetical protein
MKTYETLGEIHAACKLAMSLAPIHYPPDLQSLPGLLGAPEWYSFEHAAWPIGERIRHSFKDHNKLKLDQNVICAVMEVVECVNLRRGRQSFVMSLGFMAASPMASRLAQFLRDQDVDGQVIGTLLKMRAPGFLADVSPLMKAEKTWIRNLAKKYVQRYSTA